MMNQRSLTVIFIFVGILFAGVNFYVFSQISNGGLQFDLDKIRDKEQMAKAQAALPDIAPGESYTKSKLRDAEINRIKNSLPYSDNRFAIVYSDQTKYLTATIKAGTIRDYRENKFLAEEKLFELGTQEPCLLEVVWAVPIDLKSKLIAQDLTTRGCSS